MKKSENKFLIFINFEKINWNVTKFDNFFSILQKYLPQKIEKRIFSTIQSNISLNSIRFSPFQSSFNFPFSSSYSIAKFFSCFSIIPLIWILAFIDIVTSFPLLKSPSVLSICYLPLSPHFTNLAFNILLILL